MHEERPKERSPRKRTRSGYVALIGRPNVGKSTLLNTLLGERVAITSPHPQTTRNRILGVLTEEDAQFIFLDTPGLQEQRTKLCAFMNEEAHDALAAADVILFLTDLSRTPRPALSPKDEAILRSLPGGRPVLLVLTKVDRVVPKAALLPVLKQIGATSSFEAIIPISALRNDGVHELKRAIAGLLPHAPFQFEKDALTDKSLRFLVAEFVREQILAQTRQEVPHGVAVVVEQFDESGSVTSIEMAIHVDRESHKKIIIGKGGARLKAIGTEARKRAEDLLGKKVHLRLWVRVTKEWYQSDAQLRELGYGKDLAK